MYMIWVWLGVSALAIIHELMTMELTTIWFAIAGIITMFLAFIPHFAWPWQILVFVVLSAILLVVLRKKAKDWMTKSSEGKTNMELVVGKQVKVIEPITKDQLGTAKLNDVVWTIVEENEETVETGQYVEIIAVKGNKLVVKKLKEKKEENK